MAKNLLSTEKHFLMNLRPFVIPILVASGLFIFSCTAQKISSPTYSQYSFGDEKGYKAEFTVVDEELKPVAIIINKIKQPVAEARRNGKTYTVNVVAQSRKLANYRPEVVNEPNGIIISDGKTEKFIPVDFQLIK